MSRTQLSIVKKAVNPGLYLIQGGPGTGKSFTIISIIEAWLYKNFKSSDKILICAPSNSVADLLAERMYESKFLRDKFVRMHTESREDLFKMRLNTVKKYSLLHHALFYGEDKEYTEENLYEPFQVIGVGKYGLAKVKKHYIERFFKIKKEVEHRILNEIPIVISTCAGTLESRMKDLSFTKVIIDETTQSKEFEILKPIMNAE